MASMVKATEKVGANGNMAEAVEAGPFSIPTTTPTTTATTLATTAATTATTAYPRLHNGLFFQDLKEEALARGLLETNLPSSQEELLYFLIDGSIHLKETLEYKALRTLTSLMAMERPQLEAVSREKRRILLVEQQATKECEEENAEEEEDEEETKTDDAPSDQPEEQDHTEGRPPPPNNNPSTVPLRNQTPTTRRPIWVDSSSRQTLLDKGRLPTDRLLLGNRTPSRRRIMGEQNEDDDHPQELDKGQLQTDLLRTWRREQLEKQDRSHQQQAAASSSSSSSSSSSTTRSLQASQPLGSSTRSLHVEEEQNIRTTTMDDQPNESNNTETPPAGRREEMEHNTELHDVPIPALDKGGIQVNLVTRETPRLRRSPVDFEEEPHDRSKETSNEAPRHTTEEQTKMVHANEERGTQHEGHEDKSQAEVEETIHNAAELCKTSEEILDKLTEEAPLDRFSAARLTEEEPLDRLKQQMADFVAKQKQREAKQWRKVHEEKEKDPLKLRGAQLLEAELELVADLQRQEEEETDRLARHDEQRKKLAEQRRQVELDEKNRLIRQFEQRKRDVEQRQRQEQQPKEEKNRLIRQQEEQKKRDGEQQQQQQQEEIDRLIRHDEQRTMEAEQRRKKEHLEMDRLKIEQEEAQRKQEAEEQRRTQEEINRLRIRQEEQKKQQEAEQRRRAQEKLIQQQKEDERRKREVEQQRRAQEEMDRLRIQQEEDKKQQEAEQRRRAQEKLIEEKEQQQQDEQRKVEAERRAQEETDHRSRIQQPEQKKQQEAEQRRRAQEKLDQLRKDEQKIQEAVDRRRRAQEADSQLQLQQEQLKVEEERKQKARLEQEKLDRLRKDEQKIQDAVERRRRAQEEDNQLRLKEAQFLEEEQRKQKALQDEQLQSHQKQLGQMSRQEKLYHADQRNEESEQPEDEEWREGEQDTESTNHDLYEFSEAVANPHPTHMNPKLNKGRGYTVWCSSGSPGWHSHAVEPAKFFDSTWKSQADADSRARYLFYWNNAFGMTGEEFTDTFGGAVEEDQTSGLLLVVETCDDSEFWMVGVVQDARFGQLDQATWVRHEFDRAMTLEEYHHPASPGPGPLGRRFFPEEASVQSRASGSAPIPGWEGADLVSASQSGEDWEQYMRFYE